MPDSPNLAIPRAAYGLKMALCTLLALLVAGAACWAMGGNPASMQAALLALAMGSFATFAPAVLSIGMEHWGIAVLLSGMIRSLAAVGLAFGMTQNNPEVLTRPVMLSVASGTFLMLVAESALAVSILSNLEQRRQALKHGSPASSQGRPATEQL